MVPKPFFDLREAITCFRAVLFRMVPKLFQTLRIIFIGFRAVLFRMVPKLKIKDAIAS